MLSLGKGMVKIGLSKDWVKSVCPPPQAQPCVAPVSRVNSA